MLLVELEHKQILFYRCVSNNALTFFMLKNSVNYQQCCSNTKAISNTETTWMQESINY